MLGAAAASSVPRLVLLARQAAGCASYHAAIQTSPHLSRPGPVGLWWQQHQQPRATHLSRSPTAGDALQRAVRMADAQQQQQQQQVQQWTPQQEQFMSLAVAQARVALKMREVPIGCVIVRDGNVIGTGYNMTNHTRNATRHAELEAIDKILADHDGDVAKAGFDRCQLYVTIEPCIMCAGAVSLLGFKQVVYGAGNDKFGGCGSIMQVHEHGCGCCSGSEDGAPHGLPFEALGGLLADQAIHLLQQFYVSGNPQAPKPHRTVLEVPPWECEDVGQDGASQPQQLQPQQPPPLQQHLVQQQLDAQPDSSKHAQQLLPSQQPQVSSLNGVC